MNLYTSLTLKYLKENKRRTLVTIIGIILSTALICGIGNIFYSFMDINLEMTIKNKGAYHATYYDTNKEQAQTITKSNGISESSISKDIGNAKVYNSYLNIRSYTKDGFDNLGISLKEGKYPEKENEIVVSEQLLWATKEDLKIGDTITLDCGRRYTEDGSQIGYSSHPYGDEVLKDTKEHTFTISGIIEMPQFEIRNGIINGYSYLDEKLLNNNDDYNVSIKVNDIANIYETTNEIAQNANIVEGRLEEEENSYEIIYYNEHLLRLLGASKYDSVNEGVLAIIIFVSGLVILCTIATVYNSFSISIIERKKQFGILSSIGATKGQILKIVFLEALIISVIAIPIGIASGTLAMDILFKSIQVLFKDSMFSDLNLKVIYNKEIIIYSSLIILLTIFISIVQPAIIAAKTSPLETIKNTVDFKYKKIKTPILIKLLFKAEGVLAHKNIKRNKKRFRTTLFSIVISIIIFISFNGIMKVMMKAQDVINGDLNYDLSIYLNQGGEKIDEDTINKIANLSSVDRVAIDSTNENSEIIMTMEEEIFTQKAKESLLKENIIEEKFEEDGKSYYRVYDNQIKAPGNNEIQTIVSEYGIEGFSKEEAIKNNGVILINKTSIYEPGKRGEITTTNYKVGDTVDANISFFDGISEDKDATFKIMGIVDKELIGNQGYNQSGVDFITYNEVAQNLGIELGKNSLYLKSNDKDKTLEELENTINTELYNIDDVEEYQKQSEQMTNFINIFVYGFIIVISIISLTNIINTMSTSIMLRKKELAIINSIGVTPSGFNKMIYLESILYGLYSLIIGIPLSILSTLIVSHFVSNIVELDIVLPIEAMLISIVGVFVVTFISAYIPMKKLNKEDIIQNIRQESI